MKMPRSGAYHAYLLSPEWRKKKAGIIASWGEVCEVCWLEGGPLEVHHLTYVNLYDERDIDLALLCRPCHAGVHGYWREVREIGGESLVHSMRFWLDRWKNPPRDDKGDLLPQGKKKLIRLYCACCPGRAVCAHCRCEDWIDSDGLTHTRRHE